MELKDITEEKIEAIKKQITVLVNPYPRACYLEINLDKLCTYLAELTEVVEGKPCKCNIAPDSVHYRDCPLATYTLKEQLLEAITKKGYSTFSISEYEAEQNVVNLSDVEAIINRLIP